ncbi:uncharacterized protein F4812DRAFT_423643 [Daldinia caldariorum]|uniref:uncharacterized protein n=1 Tax=Daldinia caldariorum TaxID=326644 RepID=UPI00200790E3|nr:uncharacterized protein F4812DRAFT_423643 [Daldinia caldariorum]KAI1469561.1 hypothetical protein F4812DRAFT_423643 [Daldinia caldariorum]
MAGLEHYHMAMDPGIQKLGQMNTNRHKYFRWTPRTARITFMYMVVVPTVLGVIAYKTDVSCSNPARPETNLGKHTHQVMKIADCGGYDTDIGEMGFPSEEEGRLGQRILRGELVREGAGTTVYRFGRTTAVENRAFMKQYLLVFLQFESSILWVFELESNVEIILESDVAVYSLVEIPNSDRIIRGGVTLRRGH